MLASATHENAQYEALPQLANCLKAAGDPLRLEILRVLSHDSYGVMELSRIFDTKQSGMSHHLKVLTAAGWLGSRREGNSIFYRRAKVTDNSAQAKLQQQVYASLDEAVVSQDVARRVAAVQAERAATSTQFFAENAGKFREQQDLIASFPVYGEQVAEMLDGLDLPPEASALEVGPGEGEFLATLSPRFASVTALDNAPVMLDQAQAFANEKGLNNIKFLLGDTQTALRARLAVDCVVVNMVLHHTPSPADIFQDINRLLKPGGHLIVADLCRHDQSWAKDACGDLWQGFEPEDFSRWAAQAGLGTGQSMYFALRNGFQIQVREFTKIHQ